MERNRYSTWAALAVLTAAVLCGPAAGKLQAAALAKLDIYPPDIRLNNGLDRQHFIVVATHDDGVTADVTAQCQAALADSAPAKLEGAVVLPQANGETTLTVEYIGQKASVPVKVENVEARPPMSFTLDVMPVFMRAGCNTGSCHGSARGQDGFALSLFGYDPNGDYTRLTREIGFRRLNLADPPASLLLEKATGKVPHTGGKLMDANSEYYHTLLQWLESGAPKDEGEVPSLVDIELYPPQMVLQGAGAKQQLVARARYSDGTDRDITTLAVFMSNNDNSAPVDPSGLIAAANPGEAFMLARYDTKTVAAQVIVLPADLQYQPPGEKPVNYIDELVGEKLRKLRVKPSALCSDEVFLRRVTLDITGRLPTADECRAFLADTAADKRARAIDQLLTRKEFAEIWAMKWAELMMIRSSNQLSYKSMFLYSNWLNEQIQNNVPLDQMVREVLSTSGGTFSEPATNFYQIERDTLKTTENVAQAFMGLRIQCAQCHNHPFDRWTMDDYYSFAAFFSQIGRKEGEDYRETVIFNRGGGDVRHPVDNRVMPPKFLGGDQPDIQGRDRRQAVAEWLTAPDNPFFATSVANRIWEHFFGAGIVDPVDDVRISNPPSNPALFDTLGKKLVEYKYDFRQLVRDICNSNAYQRSTQTDQDITTAERNFAKARVRRMRAEVLLDAVSQVTETKDKFQGLPAGARAVQIADGTTSTYFLTTFGRSPRETVCACEVRTDPTLSQALHLLNGDTVQNKIQSGGVVKRLLDEKKTPDEVIEELYLRSLGRTPTDAERGELARLVGENDNKQQALEDVFWALLNSREFLFNH